MRSFTINDGRRARAGGRALLFVAMLCGVAGIMPVHAAGAAGPAVYAVTTTADGGVGSLRAAIVAANASGAASEIDVPAGLYVLATALPEITVATTLAGAGAGNTVIDGTGVASITADGLGATAAPLTVEEMTLEHAGVAQLGVDALTVDHADLVDSTGVGIASNGPLVVNDSTISSAGNTTPRGATGIAIGGADASITNSTVSDAETGVDDEGVVTIVNSTISNNRGSGVADYGAMSLVNTIVAHNGTGDCTGSTPQSDSSLDSDGTCRLADSGSISAADPLLGALAENGAGLPTRMPASASPAIGAGDAGACPVTDERGASRPVGAPCDLGAVQTIRPRVPYGIVLTGLVTRRPSFAPGKDVAPVPQGGATVTFIGAKGAQTSGTTSPNGRYVLKGLRPCPIVSRSTCRLRVASDGETFASPLTSRSPYERDQVVERDLTLGETPASFTGVVVSAGAVMPTLKLSVRVVQDNGVMYPLALLGDTAPLGAGTLGAWRLSSTTARLSSGRIYAELFEDGVQTDIASARVSRTAAGATIYTFGDLHAVPTPVPPGFVVTGVVDRRPPFAPGGSANQIAQSGATVTYVGSGGVRVTTTTDDNGRYQFRVRPCGRASSRACFVQVRGDAEQFPTPVVPVGRQVGKQVIVRDVTLGEWPGTFRGTVVAAGDISPDTDLSVRVVQDDITGARTVLADTATLGAGTTGGWSAAATRPAVGPVHAELYEDGVRTDIVTATSTTGPGGAPVYVFPDLHALPAPASGGFVLTGVVDRRPSFVPGGAAVRDPQAGLTVTFTDVAGATVSTTTMADGRYVLHGLRPCPTVSATACVLQVSGGGERFSSPIVPLDPDVGDQVAVRDITLGETPATFSGAVIGAGLVGPAIDVSVRIVQDNSNKAAPVVVADSSPMGRGTLGQWRLTAPAVRLGSGAMIAELFEDGVKVDAATATATTTPAGARLYHFDNLDAVA